MDPLVTVLAHQQVLALLAHAGALVTHDAGLAVITGPALGLEVSDELLGVDSAAGVNTLTTVTTRDQGLWFLSRVGGLCSKTLCTDGHLLRLLQEKKQSKHCTLKSTGWPKNCSLGLTC